ncbi:MAG: PilN domain-containing protein [Methylococcaceae bacterium]|nr:PilN domain-containing protein [Methylococcaceae bacterium]
MFKLDSEIDVTRFFKWWGQELRFLVPQKIYDAFKAKGSLVVQIKDSRAIVSYVYGERNELLGEFDVNALAEEELQSLIQGNANYSDAKVVLRMPEHLSVIQDIILPAAAESNLEQVIAYELNRYTPFTKEQVYYAYIKRDSESNKVQLAIRLVLVKKSTLDAMYEQCIRLGLKPTFADSAMQIVDLGQASSVYNLLPKNLCLQADKKPLFIMLGSLFVALALFITLLVLPLKIGSAGLEKLKQHARHAETSALEIEDSKKAIDYLYSSTQQVIDNKNTAPSMIEVINTVSKILNDDTWVSQMYYINKTLQITGQSGNASSLIASLEQMPIFYNVKFTSPVTKDMSSGLERFQISTEVTKEQTNAKTE